MSIYGQEGHQDLGSRVISALYLWTSIYSCHHDAELAWLLALSPKFGIVREEHHGKGRALWEPGITGLFGVDMCMLMVCVWGKRQPALPVGGEVRRGNYCYPGFRTIPPVPTATGTQVSPVIKSRQQRKEGIPPQTPRLVTHNLRILITLFLLGVRRAALTWVDILQGGSELAVATTQSLSSSPAPWAGRD